MPFTANRRRPIQVKFFVDEHELTVIKQRMSEFGTNNLSTNMLSNTWLLLNFLLFYIAPITNLFKDDIFIAYNS